MRRWDDGHFSRPNRLNALTIKKRSKRRTDVAKQLVRCLLMTQGRRSLRVIEVT